MFQKWKTSLAGFVIFSLISLFLPVAMPQSQTIRLHPAPQHTHLLNDTTLVQTQRILNYRLQQRNVSGLLRLTPHDEALILTIPNNLDQTLLLTALTQPGRLTLVETGVEFPAIDGVTLTKAAQVADPDRQIYQRLLEPSDLLRAAPLPNGKPGAVITLSAAGMTHFAEFINSRRGIYLCLAQDNIIIGCPIVQIVGEQQLEVRPGPTEFLVDFETLIAQINLGPLPFPLAIAE
jgi:hypothetical protein